jgi:hypothetical protein
MTDHLRLKAVDADDLAVMAACLQDALVPLSEMVFLPEEHRFLVAFSRFRRECLADPECHSVLAFAGVEAVKHHGVDRRLGGVKLEFLTMVAEPVADRLVSIVLIFAGDVAIQLRVREISATLRDFGEPWLAAAAPEHRLSAEGA